MVLMPGPLDLESKMLTTMPLLCNYHNFLRNTSTSDDPLENIIDKYKNHPSITCINKHINSELTFKSQLDTKN